MRRPRKWCRAQPSALTRARPPAVPRRRRALTMRQRVTLRLTGSSRRRWCQAWETPWGARGRSWPRDVVGGRRLSPWGPRARQHAQRLDPAPPCGARRGRGFGQALFLAAAAAGRTPPEEREGRLDPQDRVHRGGRLLAALTPRLCRRGLGADAAPLRPILGPRGAAAAPPGAGGQGTRRGRAAGPPCSP